MSSTYEPIATNTLGSATTTVTFSSIPSTYTDLIIVVNGAAASGGNNLGIRFNTDSGSNYSTTRMQGNGSSATSDRVSSTFIYGNSLPTTLGNGNNIIQIQNYANTTTYKTVLTRNSNPASVVGTTVGLWRGSTGSATEAITSISLSPEFSVNWVSGSTFTLYGIKAE
jgi:hypothetical protein